MTGCKIAPVPQRSYLFSRRQLHFLVWGLFLLRWVVCRSPAVNCIRLLFIFARALFQYPCLSLPAPPSSIFRVLLFLAPVSGTHFIIMITRFLCISGCVLLLLLSISTIYMAVLESCSSLTCACSLLVLPSHVASSLCVVLSRVPFFCFVSSCQAVRVQGCKGIKGQGYENVRVLEYEEV